MNVYDFQDFVDVVKKSNLGKIEVIQETEKNFHHWKKYHVQSK